MNRPLLSIAIATKNREIYCIDVIKSILGYKDQRLELVISDNSESCIIKEFIKKTNSPQVKYIYDESEISSIENFNRAVSLATGEYIIMIGDDDTILPEAIAVAEWAKKNNIDSVSSTNLINFIWPNDKLNNFESGLLSIPIYSGKSQMIDAKEKLRELIIGGFINYQSYDLPRVYHGIVKRSKMEVIREKVGSYFGGLTPDIYSSIALACVVKKHYVIDYPFSVAGACPSSSTSAATTGEHSGKFEDIPHLKNRGKYKWEEIVPKYYSVETIWAETAVKALCDLQNSELLTYFNNYRLYIYSILANRKYIFYLSLTETIKIHNFLKTNIYFHSLKLIRELVGILFEIIIKRISKKRFISNKNILVKNINNLVEAKIAINSTLANSLPSNIGEL